MEARRASERGEIGAGGRVGSVREARRRQEKSAQEVGAMVRCGLLAARERRGVLGVASTLFCAIFRLFNVCYTDATGDLKGVAH
jgi:hypothetical protein